jgi:hypothetical protein
LSLSIILSCSLIERCLALGYDARRPPVRRGKSRPAFPSLGGSGAYAIRALRDLRLGIKSESLERVMHDTLFGSAPRSARAFFVYRREPGDKCGVGQAGLAPLRIRPA